MLYRLATLALAGAITAGYADATKRFDISKVNPDVVARFRQAWHVAERGNSNNEVVVLVVKEPGGGYSSELIVDPHGFRTVTFQWDPRTVALFHTHPNHSPAGPSPQDISNSDRFQAPNFTLTSRGMWVYDPAAKKVSLVMPFLSWLKPDNWRRGRMLWPQAQRVEHRERLAADERSRDGK